ncbi:NUDIX hydrolase [Bailinhaonella thermotolerans]|uniref:NUDIX domain-containing protein n=1 Tax=Bailinhaonella thermotolerans TaxID=1070861 RepID=A0A3A4AT83_9ACTN|nr:NUDIX domain-containing protein [Bailinhaonella thermotolerans]RJL22772.1 NUDIX domain-containing protein [Bailinhaonella thermotolerans]
MAGDRPAVRIVCLDGEDRVLLMRWRDPVSGIAFWEPPGGGVDPGETPLAAARRELHEETGLDPAAVIDVSVPVDRDFTWLGVHYRKIEPFFAARFDGTPVASAAAFTDEERETFLGCAWFTPEEIKALDEVLEPPDLPEVVERLRRLL